MLVAALFLKLHKYRYRLKRQIKIHDKTVRYRRPFLATNSNNLYKNRLPL